MQGKIFLSIVVANVMCLHFNMQREDILEHTNDKCRFSNLIVSQLVDHFVP